MKKTLFVTLMSISLIFNTIDITAMAAPKQGSEKRPNIVVILFDDMSPRVGAFGDSVAHTPILDALAKESVRYPNTYSTSPVCAPSRSVLLTGVHQQTLGTMHMRTSDKHYQAVTPVGVKAFPELLRRHGYYTVTLGKTDYQFGMPFTMWDRYIPDVYNENKTVDNWQHEGIPYLSKEKPFFAYINLQLTHESYSVPKDMEPVKNNIYSQSMLNKVNSVLAQESAVTRPEDIIVPPYLPDTLIVRETMARMYDNITYDERNVAGLIESFKVAGLLDNTIIIITADQGSGLLREKAYIYHAGLHIPMMIRFPDGYAAGTIDDRLVSLVDLAPTVLSLAGVPVPDFIQGHSFIGKRTNRYVFGAGDRQDEMPERMKTVIDGRYQYIRNYRPDLPLFRLSEWYNAFPLPVEYFHLWHEGKTTAAQRYYFETPRTFEELYDLKIDPDTMKNLAGDPEHVSHLKRLRAAMDDWIAITGDLSVLPEEDLIEKMWPGQIQPQTAAPDIRISRKNGVDIAILSSATPGASIAYAFTKPVLSDKPVNIQANNDHWQLYNTPIALQPDQHLWVKAVRYGYRESEVVSYDHAR